MVEDSKALLVNLLADLQNLGVEVEVTCHRVLPGVGVPSLEVVLAFAMTCA